MNIILIGLPASGKSSIGKLLAELLGRNFIDTDDLLLEHANSQRIDANSVQEIYRRIGEENFRKLELESISKLKGYDHLVIATGGGVLLQKENQFILKENGYFILLKVSLPVLAQRISQLPPRPLFTNMNVLDKLKQLDAERFNVFQEFSDLVVDGVSTPEKIALHIYQLLPASIIMTS